MLNEAIKTVDAYILQFPIDVQNKMQELRNLILEEAPMATEKISWQMPTFVFHGTLVHFAAAKHHLGFYPTPSGVVVFKQSSSQYKSTKGGVQLPYDEPLPVDTIRSVIQFRIRENLELELMKQHPSHEKNR